MLAYATRALDRLGYDLDFTGYLPFVEFSLYVAGAGADSRLSSAIPSRTFRAINPQVEPLELDQDRSSRVHLASLSARFSSSSASYIAISVSVPPVAAV